MEKLIFCLYNEVKKKFKLQTDLQIKGSCCCRQPKAAIHQIKANNGRGGGHGHDGGRWSHPQEAAFVPHDDDDELSGGAVFVVAIVAPAHRNDVAVAPAQSQLGPVGSMRVLGEGWVQKACSVGPSKTAATTEDDGNNVLSALSTKSARFVSFCF